MNYRNKWIGLSLIALAVFSACTDEVENGGLRPGKGDHSLSFAVSTPGWQAFTKADGTHAASAPATQELESVEMEGKVNGKTVYLTAEVAESFPGDRQPMTRGTQVTDDNKTNDGMMQTFAVSAYTDKTGKPDFMYSVPTTKGSPENGTTYWYPEEKFYWPGVKTLNFYAWYPHAANAEGLTVSGADQNGAPTLHYIVPDDVKKQMDVMTAVATDQTELEAIPLTFNHALAAVKFVAGNDLPNCVVKSIKLYGLQFEGTYDIGTSTWTDVKPDKKDFTVTWGYNAVEGTEGKPITREDETFFMMPQALEGASVEVTFKDTDNSEFTVGATLTGTWEKGNTYTYRISHNFVYLGVSNERFVAYVDDDSDITNQPAFYIMAGASTAGTTGTISGAPAGVTVSPATFTSGAKIPVTITSWPKGAAKNITLTLTMDGKTKSIALERKAPAADDAFYVYSVPETTSVPFGDSYSTGDIVELQNASESDWLAITPSSTFSKDVTYQAVYDNQSKGDIYLQTLSIPAQNRFASLLACKEDVSKNVMYCVEQKAITADFGFKGCERNISREAEKWNIVLRGARLKEDVTNLKARVVISSSVPDAQISELGRDLTYGDPAAIAVDKASGTGSASYVKMRWDNLQSNAANNGTRKVNVQVCRGDADKWFDCGSDGLMSDRFYWGKNFAIGSKIYHAHLTGGGIDAWSGGFMNVFNNYEVHEKHPMFGKYRWSVMRDIYCDDRSENMDTNVQYLFFCCIKGKNGKNISSIYNQNFNTGWFMVAANDYYATPGVQNCFIDDPDNPTPSLDRIKAKGNYMAMNLKNTWKTTINQSFDHRNGAVFLPVVYTNDHCGLDERPTNDSPLGGKSVNE